MGGDRFTRIEHELKGYRSLLDGGVYDEKEGIGRVFHLDEEALSMEKVNSQVDALVDRLIMYTWEGSGWCVGKILLRNTDARRKVNRQRMNLYV